MRAEIDDNILLSTRTREQVRFVISRGADPNSFVNDNGKRYPILFAFMDRALADDGLAALEELLRSGARVNVTNHEGRSPLFHLATGLQGLFAVGAEARIAELLLDFGADAREKDSLGWTLLHAAASAKIVKPGLISKFIARGADANARAIHYSTHLRGSPSRQEHGMTVFRTADVAPLHAAALRCHGAHARDLLKAGANRDALTSDGESAIDIARNSPSSRSLEGVYLKSFEDAVKRW